MLKFGLVAALLAISTPAFAQEPPSVRSCEDAYVGITSLVTPVADNSRGFYNDESGGGPRVYVYNVDTIEPAAHSAGLAFIIPDKDSELGDSKCLAIIQLTSVDITKAKASYDGAGLHLEVPKDDYDNDTGTSKPGAPLKVRIDLKASTVEIE